MENVKNVTSKPRSKQKTNLVLFIIVGVVLVVLIAFSAWSFYSYRQVSQEVVKLSSMEGQQELAQRETEDLLSKVSKHMILPQGETPTVATVTDVEALRREQPFFNEAENGDKLLVYTNAKKAIIFSPEKDVVVNVGTLMIDQNAPAENVNAENNQENQEETQTEETENTEETQNQEELEE